MLIFGVPHTPLSSFPDPIQVNCCDRFIKNLSVLGEDAEGKKFKTWTFSRATNLGVRTYCVSLRPNDGTSLVNDDSLWPKLKTSFNNAGWANKLKSTFCVISDHQQLRINENVIISASLSVAGISVKRDSVEVGGMLDFETGFEKLKELVCELSPELMVRLDQTEVEMNSFQSIPFSSDIT